MCGEVVMSVKMGPHLDGSGDSAGDRPERHLLLTLSEGAIGPEPHPNFIEASGEAAFG